jgi:hypothetical protein
LDNKNGTKRLNTLSSKMNIEVLFGSLPNRAIEK